MPLFWGFFLGGKPMSWFNRKPRLKEPSRPSAPHRTSPVSEKILKEAKKLGPKKKLKKQ